MILFIAESPWLGLNSNQLCFGAKDNKSGAFAVKVDGHIYDVKLIHLHGKISMCQKVGGRIGLVARKT